MVVNDALETLSGEVFDDTVPLHDELGLCRPSCTRRLELLPASMQDKISTIFTTIASGTPPA